MTQSDELAPHVVPVGAEPGAPDLPPEVRDQLAQGLGQLISMAVRGAKSMTDFPACERRPWPADGVCGAVLLANTDDVGGKQVHYCHTDLPAHDVVTEHTCVCGQGWAETLDGDAEHVGPNETIVRPATP